MSVWSKLFQTWPWHNRATATDTPLNAANLQKINDAIDGIDDRVITLQQDEDNFVKKTGGTMTGTLNINSINGSSSDLHLQSSANNDVVLEAINGDDEPVGAVIISNVVTVEETFKVADLADDTVALELSAEAVDDDVRGKIRFKYDDGEDVQHEDIYIDSNGAINVSADMKINGDLRNAGAVKTDNLLPNTANAALDVNGMSVSDDDNGRIEISSGRVNDTLALISSDVEIESTDTLYLTSTDSDIEISADNVVDIDGSVVNVTADDEVDVQDIRFVKALPTAHVSCVGALYFLTNEQTGYTKGEFYECVASGQTYSWQLYSGDYMRKSDSEVISGQKTFTNSIKLNNILNTYNKEEEAKFVNARILVADATKGINDYAAVNQEGYFYLPDTTANLPSHTYTVADGYWYLMVTHDKHRRDNNESNKFSGIQHLWCKDETNSGVVRYYTRGFDYGITETNTVTFSTIGWVEQDNTAISERYVKKDGSTVITATQEVRGSVKSTLGFVIYNNSDDTTKAILNASYLGFNRSSAYIRSVDTNSPLTLRIGDDNHLTASFNTNDFSVSEGKGTVANSASQTAMGKYNVSDDQDTYALIIGNGTGNNARSNALGVKWTGETVINGDVVIGQHYDSTQSADVDSNLTVSGIVTVNGSDYAEKFEEAEPCPVNRFVTLDGEKIRLAQSDDDYILGVTSEKPAIIGDKDNDGVAVGLIGKLWVVHDGSAKVNGFVVSGKNGIATDKAFGYRVMAVDGNRCKILVK